jgi:hypothetical protein
MTRSHPRYKLSFRDLGENEALHAGGRQALKSTWFKECRSGVTPKTDGAVLAKGFSVSSGILI